MLYMGYPYGGPLEHLGEYHLHSTHSVYGTVVWDGMYHHIYGVCTPTVSSVVALWGHTTTSTYRSTHGVCVWYIWSMGSRGMHTITGNVLKGCKA